MRHGRQQRQPGDEHSVLTPPPHPPDWEEEEEDAVLFEGFGRSSCPPTPGRYLHPPDGVARSLDGLCVHCVHAYLLLISGFRFEVEARRGGGMLLYKLYVQDAISRLTEATVVFLPYSNITSC